MRLDARLGTRIRRPAKSTIRWAALLGFATASLGCADSPDTVRLEVYSWWQTEPEREAFEEVIKIHRRNHENIEVVNLGNRNSQETSRLMAAGLLAGDPPATFLANSGASLLGWTMFDTQKDADASVITEGERPSTRWIEGLSDLFRRTGLNDENRGLREPLRRDLIVPPDSVPYGVPINVHRLNVVYYNDSALTNGSFPDFETLCPSELDEPGFVPPALDLEIAIGAGQVFTMVLLTFENVLPAVLARTKSAAEVQEFYELLFQGVKPGVRDDENDAAPEIEETFRCVQHMSQWFKRLDVRDRDGNTRKAWDEAMGWAEAATAVAENNAAFTVMGDWVDGWLARELELEHVTSAPFPGTENLFVYTSDTFPLPIRTEHRAEAMALLETIASPEAQRAFSAKKGSLPARRIDDGLSLRQRRTADAFETTPKLLANSGLFPPYYPQTDLGNMLKRMTEWEILGDEALRRQRLDEALRFFTDTEPLFDLWQKRIDRGVADPPP